MLMCPTDSICF